MVGIGPVDERVEQTPAEHRRREHLHRLVEQRDPPAGRLPIHPSMRLRIDHALIKPGEAGCPKAAQPCVVRSSAAPVEDPRPDR
jgi:hypothetical protein